MQSSLFHHLVTWQWQSLYSLCYFFHASIAFIWNMAILSCPPFRMEFWWPYLFINILWIMNHSSQRDSSPFQNKNTIREHIQIQGCDLLRRELTTLSWAKIILLANQSPSRNNHVPISPSSLNQIPRTRAENSDK